MASGIYAIAHIAHLKLYVCDASSIQQKWPQMLSQLENGTYPNPVLQQVWNSQGGKRHFTFHTKQDLINDSEIIGIEQLQEYKASSTEEQWNRNLN